ncbi:outer membrane protein assembly factor [Idiomarina tyrosinivorans]|uniref:Outer membrane protein assembly factor n=1 Tax=Idiomarina tyrosinivorans TaxID=1445662 RepID=A0A432ZTI1_9GAMM|nr:outer membrane protein assembly factor [Idiomarina tyrosinivorans]RUO81096.1 outer membrane protein assembly factor [Idiomarina tyrosinivorans]
MAQKWIALGLLVCSSSSYATTVSDCKPQQTTEKQFTVGKVEIIPNPIFDESDPDTLAIHRFANWAHINTRPHVIAHRLTFKEGDQVTLQDLAEAERLVRAEPYLRDARISLINGCENAETGEPVAVSVNTWDNWSLMPTISFGRKGGKNKFSVGMKEDNFLGLGIATNLRYKRDEQRTGYHFAVGAPVTWMEHATIYTELEDNDDGQRTQLTFDKPFYEESTDTALFLNYVDDRRVEEVFQNDDTRNRYLFDGHNYEVSYGFLGSLQNHTSHRWRVGVTEDTANFSLPNGEPLENSVFLPRDRDFVYPWLEYEYRQFNYQEMEDIYLINQIEDINLGWLQRLRVGIETQQPASISGLGYHLRWHASKGTEWNHSLLLFSADIKSDINVAEVDRNLVSAQLEYFQRASEGIGYYGRLTATEGSNQFADDPVALGGESGVRGYPLQYQHGKHRISASAEARFYPNINVYKLFDVGFVGFVDAGRAWSGFESQFNEYDGVLSSVGIGLRIYSNRSSHRNVVHMNFSKPLANAPSVDSWQWGLQVKQTF